MSEIKTYAQRVAEAERATEMLEVLPWEVVSQAITKDWIGERDPAKRDDLWHDLQAISRVRNRLQQTIQDGKAALIEEKRANQPTREQVKAVSRDNYAAKLGIDLHG